MSQRATETTPTDIGTVLAAITDPTRRQVLESLRAGPRSVGDIAADHAVSRPAIDPTGLGILRGYVDGFWIDVLAAFQAAALLEHAKGRKPN
jgi:DNA-binding transcriptional ArsR family regulator